MRVIGIDLGLKQFGVVVLGADTVAVERNFLLSQTDDLGNFLVEIYNALHLLMNDIARYKDDVFVVVEKPVALRGHAQVLEELLGVVRLVCAMRMVPVLFVSPSSLKKFVVGSGVAKKSQLVLALYKKFGLEFFAEDLVDAFWLAYFGICFMSLPEDASLVRKIQVDKFRKKYSDLYKSLVFSG
mgnify:CR=1 FL=1